MTNESTLVPLRLARVVLRDHADQQWIFLQEVLEESDPSYPGRGFPIVIGTHEAEELHRVLTDVHVERPLTHQLTASIVDHLGSEVAGVDIVDLRSNTYYARLLLRLPDSDANTPPVAVDARPSDAIVLALRAGAPIRIVESVLEQVRTDKSVDKLPDEGEEPGEEL
ncbi:MAG: bifunctional nuclease family protein [Planctomycetota bacterium]